MKDATSLPPPPEPIAGISTLPHGEFQQAVLFVATRRTLRLSSAISVVAGAFFAIMVGYILVIAAGHPGLFSPLLSVFPHSAWWIVFLVFMGLASVYIIGCTIGNLLVLLLPLPSAARVQAAMPVIKLGVDYRRLATLFQVEPSPAMREQAQQALDRLLKAPVAQSADVLAFSTTDRLYRSTGWRVLLRGNLALLHASLPFSAHSQLNLHTLRFLFPGELRIDAEPSGEKKIKAAFTIGEKTYRGTISAQCLERYEAWKVKNESSVVKV